MSTIEYNPPEIKDYRRGDLEDGLRNAVNRLIRFYVDEDELSPEAARERASAISAAEAGD